MTPPRETIADGAPSICLICGKKLILKVCCSAVGYYIGTFCCEPHSRESGYYGTREEAESDLGSFTPMI